MKKLIFSISVIALLGTSCKKDDTPTPTPPAADKYMSVTAASTWNYELTDNSAPAPVVKLYTVTSANRDSTINTKAYHVFTNSGGSGNEYYYIGGNDYYNFRSLPAAFGGANVENIYLKDNVLANNGWPQPYPITVNGISTTATLTNTITAKGLTKVVNSISYTDVIQVTTTIAVVGVPPAALITDIQSFYAPKFGLIQSVNKINLNYLGAVANVNQTTILKSADIK
ncbi:MAG: hypothetical protein ABIN67_08660 [Ferruginibacter sp.]